MSRRNAFLGGTAPRLGLIALVVIFILVALRLIFPSALLSLASPFLRAGDALSTGTDNFFAGFDNTANVANERNLLASDNATLAQQNAVLTAKVADLETLLGSTSATAPGVVAGVLARPPETAYDTLIVGSGSDAGVAAGDVAYAPSGIPLGVVTATAASSARITLLSAPAESTDAWVGDTRVPITLLGAGGSSFIAQVPRAASTTLGEAVYVSGPGSVPIGKVAAETGDASAPVITLDIAGAVDIFSLTEVLVRDTGPSTWPAAAPVATSTPL